MTEQKTTAVATTPDKNEGWRPLMEAIVSRRPDLKSSLTVAAVSTFMALPDSSFGWTNEEGGMKKEQKALAIIAHLQNDLFPGMGHIYFLGNKLYLSADGLRYKANNSGRFKFVGKRTLRALNEDEKAMLWWEEGDRAMALEQDILVNGVKIPSVGYAIIEKRDLDYRSKSGFPRPGLGSKKDVYQTLVTRCERDIFKHYLPLEGVSSDEPTKDDVIDVTPEEPVNQVTIQAHEDLITLRAEFMKAAEAVKPSRCCEILGQDAEKYLLAHYDDSGCLSGATIALQEEARQESPPKVRGPKKLPTDGPVDETVPF